MVADRDCRPAVSESISALPTGVKKGVERTMVGISAAESTATPQYARAARVLWRLAPDRVIVRRVGDRTADAAAELTGSAAVLWLALQSPRSEAQLCAELQAAGSADPAKELHVALAMLADRCLIAVCAP